MKFFSKSELIAILIIFAVLIVISVPNFTSSIKKARDQSRKDDLGSIVNALDKYQLDFDKFPMASSDGRILACKRLEDKAIVNFVPCDWGKDALADLTLGSNNVYVSPIPRDPDFLVRGSTYMYFSDGSRYQLYASLESHDWDEYDPKIISRNIMCGTQVCNVGRSFSTTPTDISIEEYEKQLKAQEKK